MTDADTLLVADNAETDLLLSQAIAFQQECKFQEAESLYQTLLQLQPDHPEANYSIGLLALKMNLAQASLHYFTVALQADPVNRQYWLSYIYALFQSGQPVFLIKAACHFKTSRKHYFDIQVKDNS